MKPAPASLPHWPRMLRRDLAAAYCGISTETFEAHCPVAPTDLGARVLAWDRNRLDLWLDGRPIRPNARQKIDAALSPPLANAAPSAPNEPLTAEERRARSLERVRCGTKKTRRHAGRDHAPPPA